MVTSSIKNWGPALDALHGNSFGLDTLKQSLDQIKGINGWQPLHACCDRKCWGVDKETTNSMVHLAGKMKRSMKSGIWRW